MADQKNRPAGRVIKADERPKTGVITIEKTPGVFSYRCPCDVCGEVEEVHFLPKQNRVFHCRICRRIATKGKPSTEYSRRGDEVRYHTQCDRCETIQETTFLPMRERQFLCDTCMRSERGERQNERPVKRGVKVLGNEANPRYSVPCDECRKPQEVAFAPRDGERFICKSCFATRRLKAEKRREKPETRIIFNIECIKCGRKETLDFVPTHPSEALCTACFPKKDRRK